MSIPVVLFLGATIPIAVVCHGIALWLMNRIFTVSRQNIVITTLGFCIFGASLEWQGYQKYVLNTPVSVLSRILSYVGLFVFMSGVYLHGLARQRAMREHSAEGLRK